MLLRQARWKPRSQTTQIRLVSWSCWPHSGHFLQLGHSQLGNSLMRRNNASEQPRHLEWPDRPHTEQVISSSLSCLSPLPHIPQRDTRLDREPILAATGVVVADDFDDTELYICTTLSIDESIELAAVLVEVDTVFIVGDAGCLAAR